MYDFRFIYDANAGLYVNTSEFCFFKLICIQLKIEINNSISNFSFNIILLN